MRVYKFMSADFARKVIAERRLKISTFVDMNDVFEVSGVRLTGEPAEWLIRFETFVRDNLSKNYGALCFSSCYGEPVLWAHCADEHEGVCLGFDLIPGPTVEPKETNYVRERKDKSISALLGHVRMAFQQSRELTLEV